MREPKDILDKELKVLKPDGFIALYFKINRGIILKLFKDIQIEAYNQAIVEASKEAYKDIRKYRKMYTDLQPVLKKNQMPSAKKFKCSFILKLKK